MRPVLVLFAVLLAVSAFACAAQEKETEGGSEKLSPDKVPAKVMDAAKARFPSAEWRSITREEENNMTIYDFELTSDGKKYEMDIKDDGTILEIEKEIAETDLPDAVKKAVYAKYPKAQMKEVLEKSLIKDGNETPHEYEVVLTTEAGKEAEVTLSLDGKITEEGGGEEEKEKEKAAK
jgi:hypothetical protein